MISINRVNVSRWKIPISIFTLNIYVIGVLVIALALGSCVEDKSSEIDIKGYWEIAEAFRNNKPTLTLENAFINIESDSTLITNLLRKEVQSDYTRENDKIRQSSPELIEYQILKLSNDSLELQTEIRGYNFNFILLKRDSVTAE